MTRDQAIADILAAIDQARAPAAPELAPAQPAQENKAAARKRRADHPSSSAEVSGDTPAASSLSAALAAAPPPAAGGFSENLQPSLTGVADEKPGDLGAGGDDEAAAEQRHRELELKRDALNIELARLPLTDLGNVERFRRRFSDQFKWSAALGWFFWDGKRWSRDGAESKVIIASHETVRAIQDEAAALRDEATAIANEFDAADLAKREKALEKQLKKDKGAGRPKLELVHNVDDPNLAKKKAKKREESEEKWRARLFLKMWFLRSEANALAAWGRDSEMNARMAPVYKHAAPYLATKIEAFDADPWAINVNNGTLYVDRALPGMIGFKPHDQADLITKISPVDYDPAADAPIFSAFMQKIQPDEGFADNRRFIIDWLGYALTGDNAEQQLAVFHGLGGNGKGVLIRIATYIAGDYARTTPIETFLAEASPRNASAPTPERAALPGIRMLTANEPEKGAKFNEGFIKEVTGGDRISARDLNKSQFEFTPVFKLTISANHKPLIKDQTEGIWRRMNLVPFPVKVPKGEWDLKLDDKLRAEAAGVLNVLLDGLRNVLVNGLVQSEATKAATRQYREDSDPLGRFLTDCTEAADDKVQSTHLHELYLAWAQATGGPEWRHTGFTNAMKERGIETKKISVMYFVGLRTTKTVKDFGSGGGVESGAASAPAAKVGGNPRDDVVDF